MRISNIIVLPVMPYRPPNCNPGPVPPWLECRVSVVVEGVRLIGCKQYV